MLELPERSPSLTQRAEPIDEFLIWGTLNPHGQSINQWPRNFPHTGARYVTARFHCAKNHILVTAVATQDHGPGSLQKRIEGQAVRLAEFTQGPDCLLAEHRFFFCPVSSRGRAVFAALADWQCCRRGKPLQSATPKTLRFGPILSL